MSIERLLEIVATLRSENGCPWDREQNLESIKQYLVEECYELIDAIDSGEPQKHCEELGDVLLQVVLQARMQHERGSFSFDDVVESLCAKLVRRHPHVFGDASVSGSEEVLRNWERIKAEEKRKLNKSRADGSPGNVPRQLPALRLAHQVQSRAARTGPYETAHSDPLREIEEELGKIRNVEGNGEHERFKNEIGKLLFAVVSLCRARGVNAEDALRGAVDSFVSCFYQ